MQEGEHHTAIKCTNDALEDGTNATAAALALAVKEDCATEAPATWLVDAPSEPSRLANTTNQKGNHERKHK